MLQGCCSQLAGVPGGGGGNGTDFWRDAEFPSFLVNVLGLRDKREQLSDSGFIRTGSACRSPSPGAEHDQSQARQRWAGHSEHPEHQGRLGWVLCQGEGWGSRGDQIEARGRCEHPALGPAARRPRRAQMGSQARCLALLLLESSTQGTVA